MTAFEMPMHGRMGRASPTVLFDLLFRQLLAGPDIHGDGCEAHSRFAAAKSKQPSIQ
jgi:hypothetical protein